MYGLNMPSEPRVNGSRLLDLFFDGLSAHKLKRHYHQFVLEIYQGVWLETRRRKADTRPIEMPAPIPWTKALRDRWRLCSGRVLSPHQRRSTRLFHRFLPSLF